MKFQSSAWIEIENMDFHSSKMTDRNCKIYRRRIAKPRTIDVYTHSVYNLSMIKSFADKETQKVYNQIFSKKLPNDIQRIALRKLIMINNAQTLADLLMPPANHLEKLKGDRLGQYSIRINAQFRICFWFENGEANEVEITDYH